MYRRSALEMNRISKTFFFSIYLWLEVQYFHIWRSIFFPNIHVCTKSECPEGGLPQLKDLINISSCTSRHPERALVLSNMASLKSSANMHIKIGKDKVRDRGHTKEIKIISSTLTILYVCVCNHWVRKHIELQFRHANTCTCNG